MKRVELTGKVFGKLTVIAFSHVDNTGHTCWACKCECGKYKTISSHDLKRGTKSCGCIVLMQLVTHGKSTRGAGHKNRVYRSWCAMRHRCNTPSAISYKYYGAKGIKVCKEWDIFENFDRWSINNGAKDCLVIDRINPLLGYSPENCQWITPRENSIKANKQKRRNNAD